MSASYESEPRFATLVREHLATIERYAARRVPPAAVEDVVAEVFATAWRHRAGIPEPPKFWLLRTAWFHVQHHYRQQRRDERVTARIAGLRTESVADTQDETAEQLLVRAAVAQLADTDQEVIRLTAWEELTPAEAADVLGCSQVAVRVRLHRARRRLARLLAPVPTVNSIHEVPR